jgi:diketogulonate reductase-like aldo/keto reductase
LATKATSDEHLKQDLDLFSWQLSKEEVSAIDVYNNGTVKVLLWLQNFQKITVHQQMKNL